MNLIPSKSLIFHFRIKMRKYFSYIFQPLGVAWNQFPWQLEHFMDVWLEYLVTPQKTIPVDTESMEVQVHLSEHLSFNCNYTQLIGCSNFLVFNSVIRLCVTSLYPYLRKLLNLRSASVTKSNIESSKRWPAAKNTVRNYIVDLVKVIR